MLIIRLWSPKVGKTVYTPSCVKGEGVTESIANEESIPDTFIPEVPRYCNWYNDIANCAEKLVMPGINYKEQMLISELYVLPKRFIV